MKLTISDYCIVKNNSVLKNGLIMFESDKEMEGKIFFDFFYRSQINNYPKYYKMDELSKLAFITAETLLQGNSIKDGYTNEETAIVINNSSSSLETDKKYYETIRNINEFFPSPALFVYTVPNIMIGEVCIRNKIMGESILFISKEWDYNSLVSNVESLFSCAGMKCCLAGIVELSKEYYESFLCLVEGNENIHDPRILFNEENLKRIFENRKGNLNGTINR
jgi:hypothetical protein